jgi:hypothetical protein
LSIVSYREKPRVVDRGFWAGKDFRDVMKGVPGKPVDEDWQINKGALPYRGWLVPALSLQGWHVKGSLFGMVYPIGHRAGLRDSVREFSQASRRRLMEAICRVAWDWLDPARVYVMTLTYPSVFPWGVEAPKRHLRLLQKQLAYEFGGCEFVWKMEFQFRGAVHFHLLGSVAGDFREVRRKVLRAWYKIVRDWVLEEYPVNGELLFEGGLRGKFVRFLLWRGEGDRKGVVEIVGDVKKTAVYYSAYITADGRKRLSKEEQHVPPPGVDPGRYWGVLGKGSGLLPRPVEDLYLSLGAYMELRRLVRRLMRRKGRFFCPWRFGFRFNSLGTETQRQILAYLGGLEHERKEGFSGKAFEAGASGASRPGAVFLGN